MLENTSHEPQQLNITTLTISEKDLPFYQTAHIAFGRNFDFLGMIIEENDINLYLNLTLKQNTHPKYSLDLFNELVSFAKTHFKPEEIFSKKSNVRISHLMRQKCYNMKRSRQLK